MADGERSAHRPKIVGRVADPEQRRDLELARKFGITVKELYGWTVTEVHTPNPDGSVTVTRDSPWDEDERDAQHALDELVCPSCGNLRAVCSDPEVLWYPQRVTCYATASREVAKRRAMKKHEKTTPGNDLHPLDGLSVWVSRDDLTPDDDFC